MSCSHLTGKYMLSCTARNEVYVPSGFEFDEYCTSSRYKLCPFYDQDRPYDNGRSVPASDTDRFARETQTAYGREFH